MTQIRDIRKMYFEEGKNVSQISKETGHDRKTIRGYLNKEYWNRDLPRVKNLDIQNLIHTSLILTGG